MRCFSLKKYDCSREYNVKNKSLNQNHIKQLTKIIELARMSTERIYKIALDPIYGRHLIAARDIHPGESIIDEPPLVAGPVSNDSSTFTINEREVDICPVCCLLIDDENETKKNFLCDKCGLKLCSSSCSNDPCHKNQECQILKNLTGSFNLIKTLKKKALYNLINVIRCLFHRIVSPEVKWTQVLQLESKVKALEKVGAFTELDPIFELLTWEFFIDNNKSDSNSSSIMNKLSNEDIKSAARHCLGVMRTNAFSSFTNTHAREGLYFLSSLMSHNCVMNTDRQIDHDRMVTRAAVTIKQGEPITTSYLSYLSGTPERFNETRSTWLFTCRCARCIDPTECGTHMSTVACPACNRLTLQPNLTQFSSTINVGEPDNLIYWNCANPVCNHVLEIGTSPQALDMVHKSRPPITQDALAIEEWLDKYDTGEFLHSNHYLFVQMKFYLCQFYGRGANGISELGINQLQKKVKYCLEILEIFNQLFKGIYIFRGTILFELWSSLNEIQRRIQMDQNPTCHFETINCSDNQVDRIRKDALSILKYALPNSAEESMALFLQENNESL